MPRYFFHLHNDEDAQDDLGEELMGLVEAKRRAIKYARFEASQSTLRGQLTLSHRIDVEDERGRKLTSVFFRDAVTVLP